MGTTFQLRTRSTRDVTRRVLIPLLVTMSLVLSQLVVLGVGAAHAAGVSGYITFSDGDGTVHQVDITDPDQQGADITIDGYSWDESNDGTFHISCSQTLLGTTATVTGPNDDGIVWPGGVGSKVTIVDFDIFRQPGSGNPQGCSPDTFAAIAITKTAVSDGSEITEVELDQTFQYEIVVESLVTDKPTDAVAVVLEDTLPAGVSFVSVSPSPPCAEAAGTVTCELGDMPQGTSFTATITVTVDQDAVCGDLDNLAEASSFNTLPAEDNALVTLACPQGPELQITKTVDDGSSTTILPGGAATYLITVSNTGDQPATGVEVTDVLNLGSGALSVTAVSPSQGDCDPEASGLEHGDTLTCEFGTIDAGDDATVAITLLAADFDSCGTVTNIASVTSVEDAVDKTSDQVSITVDPCDPELDIVKTVDGSDTGVEVAPGDSFTYVLTVTNESDATATAEDVVVTDTLDLGGTTLSVTSVTPSQGSCGPAVIVDGATLSCDLGDLGPGDTATITLVIAVAAIDSCGAVDNVAFAVADNHEQVSSNTVDVDVDGCSTDLTGAKTLTAPVTGEIPAVDGETATFELSVTNDDDATQTATGVTISDTVPDALVVQAPVNWVLNGSNGPCTVAGQQIDCGPFTLAPGETVTATVDVQLDLSQLNIGDDGTKCGVIDNIASFSSNEQDIADAIDSVAVVGCDPDLSFTKDADTETLTVGSDDTVTYTLTAKNDEDATASATVSVFDTVPNVFEIVSVTSAPADACFSIGRDVSCAGVLLAPGESLVVMIEVVLAGGPDASQCGEWPNSAQLFEGEVLTDSDVATVTVEGCEPGIALDKTAVALLDADGLVLDEVVLLDPDGPKQLLVSVHGTDAVEITYLFEVTNTGNVFLHDVELDDPLLGGPITLSSTTLAPGESATGSATYTLDRVLDVEAGEVVNVATATGSTDDGDDVTDTDDELVEVLAVETGIALEKLVDVPVGDDGLQVIEIGEDETATLTYTYIVTNIGTDPLTDLTLVDDNLPGVDLTAALNEAAAAAFPELAAELGTPAIPPGGEVKVTAVYEVTEADVAAGQVTNVAIAGGVGATSGEQVEADDTATVDIVEVLDVVLERPKAPVEPEPLVETRALPKTGVDGEHLFAIGILLAALGAATLLFTPRRRRTA